MISLLFLLAGIIVNIIGIITIYPAFSQWKKMSNCVYNAFKNDEMQDTLYDEFIQLNLNLLLDENKRIKETLNNIKQKSNQLFKDTSKQYETYTRISKIYQQKEYYWKINLTSLVVHVGLFAYVIFLLH